MGTDERTRQTVVTALMFIYLGSGACALIDEAVWLRLLKLSLGNTVHASSAVVSVFMAESAADEFERLRQAALGLRIMPGQPALTLIKHSVEQGLLEWGLKLIDAGNVGATKEAARRMLEIDPNCAPAWVLHAQAERALGDVAAAEAAAHHVLGLAPQDLGVQLSLWSLLVSAGDTQGAVTILEAATQVLRGDPNSVLSRRLSTPGF